MHFNTHYNVTIIIIYHENTSNNVFIQDQILLKEYKYEIQYDNHEIVHGLLSEFLTKITRAVADRKRKNDFLPSKTFV